VTVIATGFDEKKGAIHNQNPSGQTQRTPITPILGEQRRPVQAEPEDNTTKTGNISGVPEDTFEIPAFIRNRKK
jgi:hypothetical protein